MTDVQNKSGIPVHSTTAPLNVGDEVDVEVDWGRRWDHMQQHSGFSDVMCALHLLNPSAVIIMLKSHSSRMLLHAMVLMFV